MPGLEQPDSAASRQFYRMFAGPVSASRDFVKGDLGQPLAMASSLQDAKTVVQFVSSSNPGLVGDHGWPA